MFDTRTTDLIRRVPAHFVVVGGADARQRERRLRCLHIQVLHQFLGIHGGGGVEDHTRRSTDDLVGLQTKSSGGAIADAADTRALRVVGRQQANARLLQQLASFWIDRLE